MSTGGDLPGVVHGLVIFRIYIIGMALFQHTCCLSVHCDVMYMYSVHTYKPLINELINCANQVPMLGRYLP